MSVKHHLTCRLHVLTLLKENKCCITMLERVAKAYFDPCAAFAYAYAQVGPVFTGQALL